MLHLSPAVRYYLYTSHTDMRKGFDSLCGIVSSQMALDTLSGAVFIFINKKRNQVIRLWRSGKVMPASAGTGGVYRSITSAWKKALTNGRHLVKPPPAQH